MQSTCPFLPAYLGGLLLIVGASFVLTSPLRAMPANELWTLVWQDEFEGDTIDPAKWNLVFSGGGFGNYEAQYYTDRDENAFIRDGRLVIRAKREAFRGYEYTSAKLTTEGKASWTYGRFEIRARLPIGQGIWPAIWMMPEPETQHGRWPIGGEIDIMEIIGSSPRTMFGTLHFGNPHHNSGAANQLEGDGTFADDFHVFAFEWEPGAMHWFLDGKHFNTETNWFTSAPGAMWPAPFDRPFFLILNVAVGGKWPGYPDQTTPFPAEMEVDYVRVYRFNGEYPPVPIRPASAEDRPPRAPAPDGNLVYNGDFSEGEEYWSMRTMERGQATIHVEDGVARIQITHAGDRLHSIQLKQGPINIRREGSYRIAFRARAAAPRTISVNLGKASQHWDSWSGRTTVHLGTEWNDFTIGFKMRQPTDPMARLEFNLGLSDIDVFFKDVSVRPLEEETVYRFDRTLKVEAEAFDEAFGIHLEPCLDGGINVGWMAPGDWLEYKVEFLRPGPGRIAFRHAGEGQTGQLRVEIDGALLAEVDLPPTGGWQDWRTREVAVEFPEGIRTLRLLVTEPGMNLNWLELISDDEPAARSPAPPRP